MQCRLCFLKRESSRFGAKLYIFIFEHNEAVIKMIIKGRSPTMRHASRTRRVHTIFFTESTWTQRSKSNVLRPKNQLAGLLTKGSFSRDEWDHFLCLFNISNFSSVSCLQTMSKRIQGKKRRSNNYGKVKTDVGPGFEDYSKLFNGAEFECIELLGDTQSTQSQHESYSMPGETCS